MDQSQSQPEGRAAEPSPAEPSPTEPGPTELSPTELSPTEPRPTEPRPDAPGSRLLPVAVVLAASWGTLAGLAWWMVAPGNPFSLATMVGSAASWLVLAVAVRCLGRLPRQAVAPVIIAGGLLLGFVGLSAPPSTSNDAARYAWDGIVQKAGISPYSFVPIDETLSALRPSWLFAEGSADTDGRPQCRAGLFATDAVPASGYPSGEPLCTAINRPQAPTIYLPTAELYFLAIRALVPDAVGHGALQAAGLVLSTAIGLGLLRLLALNGRPVHYAAVWSWNPLVLLEAVNNAHVDVLGAALLLAAGAFLASRHPLRSGAAFGAAVATKLVPAISAPALLFHRPVRFIAGAAATFVLVYVPYVAVAGPGVLGFLPGYLTEEGYNDGGSLRFALARMLAGGAVSGGGPLSGLQAVLPILLTGVALAAVALHLLRSTTERNMWETQTLIIGLTLLLVSPGYPWYALLLLPCLVMSRRWECVGVIIALDSLYMLPIDASSGDAAQRAMLVAAGAAIAVGHWLRRRREVIAAASQSSPHNAGRLTGTGQ